MLKIEIKNKQGVMKWGAKFETQEEADAWISENILKNTWGKPERWVWDSDLQKEGLNSEDAIDSNVINYFGENKTYYKFEKEYEIIQTDITEQVEEEIGIEEQLRKQVIGQKIIAIVSYINSKKLESGQMSIPTFQAMLADVTIQSIERLLWNGSINTAKQLIGLLDDTYWSDAEKQSIISKIDQELGAL